MYSPKLEVIKPLLESSEGIHVTIYLENTNNDQYLRQQLLDSIAAAHAYLKPVMEPSELNRILQPFHDLLDRDQEILRAVDGNIGLFRTQKFFRVLHVPVPVEQTCVVATTFHVKPLLRWIQTDREFLVLHLGAETASLYRGDLNSLKLVDSLPYPPASVRKITEEIACWIVEEHLALPKRMRPRLYIAGIELMTTPLAANLAVTKRERPEVLASRDGQSLLQMIGLVRAKIKEESKQLLAYSLMEFYHADELNLAKTNLFQIAKAAVRGKVKKLIIADGIQIFGKLDRTTGGVAIHPADLDHEDDDLLDDLAQEVLAKGGEVIVAPRADIPKGRPVLAVLQPNEGEQKRTLGRYRSLSFALKREAI